MKEWIQIYICLASLAGFILIISGIINYIQTFGKSDAWIFILIGIFLFLSVWKLTKKYSPYDIW